MSCCGCTNLSQRALAFRLQRTPAFPLSRSCALPLERSTLPPGMLKPAPCPPITQQLPVFSMQLVCYLLLVPFALLRACTF